MFVVTGGLKPLGYQQLSVAGTAATLTVPAGTTLAMLAIESNAVRYRDDGTSPTSTVGMPMSVGTQNFPYTGYLGGVQFIAQSGTATLDVNYYQGQH